MARSKWTSTSEDLRSAKFRFKNIKRQHSCCPFLIKLTPSLPPLYGQVNIQKFLRRLSKPLILLEHWLFLKFEKTLQELWNQQSLTLTASQMNGSQIAKTRQQLHSVRAPLDMLSPLSLVLCNWCCECPPWRAFIETPLKLSRFPTFKVYCRRRDLISSLLSIANSRLRFPAS